MHGEIVLKVLNDRVSEKVTRYQLLFSENQFDWGRGLTREVLTGNNVTWEVRVPMNFSEEGIYCKLVGQVRKFRKPPFSNAAAFEKYLNSTEVVQDMRSKMELDLKVFMGGERHMGYVYYVEFNLT